jgi:hypothetical protein
MLDAIEKGLAKEQAKEVAAGEKKTEGLPQEAKPEDKNQDGVPEGLSPKAQQRFKELVTMVKEKDAEIERVRGETQQAVSYAQEMSTMIRNIGATGEQMQAAAAYIQAYNSGDLNTRRNILVNELRDIQMRMGEPIDDMVTASDPLAQFPDLAEAVQGYQMNRQQALEIAKYRAQEQAQLAQQQQSYQAQTQRQQAVQGWVNEKNSAIAEITQMTKQMAATDPYYPAIEAQLMGPNGGLKDLVENFPPSTWVPQVKMLISNLKTAMAANGGGAGGPRPLSGGGGKPQGSAKPPSSMYDAMFGGRS